MDALFILHPNTEYAEFVCKTKICNSRWSYEAEEEIKTNKRLEILNKRIREISYITSHDFRAHAITIQKYDYDFFDFEKDILPKFKEIIEWFFNEELNIIIEDRRDRMKLHPDSDI